jgi:hypothetical protein
MLLPALADSSPWLGFSDGETRANLMVLETRKPERFRPAERDVSSVCGFRSRLESVRAEQAKTVAQGKSLIMVTRGPAMT